MLEGKNCWHAQELGRLLLCMALSVAWGFAGFNPFQHKLLHDIMHRNEVFFWGQEVPLGTHTSTAHY